MKKILLLSVILFCGVLAQSKVGSAKEASDSNTYDRMVKLYEFPGTISDRETPFNRADIAYKKYATEFNQALVDNGIMDELGRPTSPFFTEEMMDQIENAFEAGAKIYNGRDYMLKLTTTQQEARVWDANLKLLIKRIQKEISDPAYKVKMAIQLYESQ